MLVLPNVYQSKASSIKTVTYREYTGLAKRPSAIGTNTSSRSATTIIVARSGFDWEFSIKMLRDDFLARDRTHGKVVELQCPIEGNETYSTVCRYARLSGRAIF